MPFGFFRSNHSPILADFGSSGVKLLQVQPGERPSVSAAAFVAFSDELRAQGIDERFDFLATTLPAALKAGGFRGNRVVLAPFSQHMLVQHVGIAAADAERAESVVATQVAVGLGCDPASLVVRSSRVCETTRDGQPKIEMIAFAMSRNDVMRYVELFKRAKVAVVGVHGEISALVHAFDHVNRRVEDTSTTTMYVDLGYSGTQVAICHGPQLVFAKSIAVAGRSFDARIAEARRISLGAARTLRLAEGVRPVRTPGERAAPVAGEPRAASASAAPEAMPAILRAALAQEAATEALASPVAEATERRVGQPSPALGASLPSQSVASIATECRETVESLCDEVGMCARYYGGLFRERRIDRVVFLGGEARDIGLCQALAASLRIPAKAGDPMARFLSNGAAPEGLPDADSPHPGWAVACGLASAPTDL
jgi:Tfp pilus assembly PilM family ATPase